MNMLNENPSVVVKRKNIQQIFDYCLDSRIEFKILPRSMQDEWDVEFVISDIMKAVELGMFLKENKLELVGFAMTASKPAPVNKPKASKKAEKEEATVRAVKKEAVAPAPESATSVIAEKEPTFLSKTAEPINEDIFASSYSTTFSEDDNNTSADALFGTAESEPHPLSFEAPISSASSPGHDALFPQ